MLDRLAKKSRMTIEHKVVQNAKYIALKLNKIISHFL